MTPDRSLRVRSLWVAVLAALCVLAYGSPAHPAPSVVAAAAQGHAPITAGSARAVLAADFDLGSRTFAAPGTAHHVPFSAAEPVAIAAVLVLAGLFFLRRRQQQHAPTAGQGTWSARAPPLTA